MVEDCDFLVIGGGVGAYNAAKRLRRLDSAARITVISADALPPYDLPPLSKDLLRGTKTETDLIFPALESLGQAPIDIRLSTTVTHLDPEAGRAVTAAGDEISFRAAVLATGGSPIRLNVPGGDLPQVHYLRSAADGARLRRDVQAARQAVVIGAGLIGIEVAASLRAMGLEVTVVEAEARIWGRFADPDLAERVRSRCEAEGIKFVLNARVSAIVEDGDATVVETLSGERLACNLVVVGVGIRPNLDLARAAGLEVADGVVVDAFMRTSAPNIYAVGDVAAYPDPHLGRITRAEHWGHAEYSGQIAATNMAGGAASYDFLSYAWSDIFDLHIETAGHLQSYDRCVSRGDIDGWRFINLYFKADRLVAYISVNGQTADLPALRRLIRSKQRVSCPSRLGDASLPVKMAISAPA